MSNLNIHDLTSSSVPFFARYLEAPCYQELSQEDANNIHGGKTKINTGNPGIDPSQFVCTNLYTFSPPGDGDCYEITPSGPRPLNPPNSGELLEW